MLTRVERLDEWLVEQIRSVEHRDEVVAYVADVLSHPSRCDMSKESVVIAFSKARETMRFETFQRIGDWTLWSLSNMTSLDVSIETVHESFGSMSYAICDSMLKGQWKLYKTLSIELPELTKKISTVIHKVQR